MAEMIEIRPATGADRDAWAGLFRDYMVFYGCAVSETALDTTWGWIIDPDGPWTACWLSGTVRRSDLPNTALCRKP